MNVEIWAADVTPAVLTQIVEKSVAEGNIGMAEDAAHRNGTSLTSAQYVAIGDYYHARLGESSDTHDLIAAMSAYERAGGRARLVEIGDRLMVQMTENPMVDFTMEAYLCFEGQPDRLRRVGEIAARLGSTGVAALAYAEAGDSGVAQFFGQF